jgi:hypothetical protein
VVNSIYRSLYFNNYIHAHLFTYIVTHLTFVTVITLDSYVSYEGERRLYLRCNLYCDILGLDGVSIVT